ncbi:MAG: hypothetical protein SV765_13470 [Pseudomonadota bacterium]|nr:hypothetical protein [Pseudomonadota bacterium]
MSRIMTPPWPRWADLKLPLLSWLAAAVLLLAGCSVRAEEDKPFSIEPVKGNVYRVLAGHCRSVFMVTDAGIFVADPINPAAARWLKSQLQARFDAPVRYLAYSHSHPDHALGGGGAGWSGRHCHRP